MSLEELKNLMLFQIETVDENLCNEHLKKNQRTTNLKSRCQGSYNSFDVYCSVGQGNLIKDFIGFAFLTGKNKIKDYGIYPWVYYNYSTKEIGIKIGCASGKWIDSYYSNLISEIDLNEAKEFYESYNFNLKISVSNKEDIITTIIKELETIFPKYKKYYNLV